MTYTLNDKDLETLNGLTQAAIKEARAMPEVTDDDIAHLYALRGKLLKLHAGRGNGTTEPKKDRKVRTKKTATPEPATGA